MGKYLREFTEAPTVSTSSIMAVSEETTDISYKITVGDVLKLVVPTALMATTIVHGSYISFCNLTIDLRYAVISVKYQFSSLHATLSGAETGDIYADNVFASNNIQAAGNIFTTGTGNIVSNTTVTAGTGIVVTTGDIGVLDGDISCGESSVICGAVNAQFEITTVDIIASGGIACEDIGTSGTIASDGDNAGISTSGDNSGLSLYGTNSSIMLFEDGSNITIRHGELKVEGTVGTDGNITASGQLDCKSINCTQAGAYMDINGFITCDGDFTSGGAIEAATGFESTAGDIIGHAWVKGVDIYASHELSSHSNITSATGNIVATAGNIGCVDVVATGDVGCVNVNATGDVGCVNVNATGSVSAGTGISTTAGNIATSSGAISCTGDITSTGGDITTNAGEIGGTSLAVGSFKVFSSGIQENMSQPASRIRLSGTQTISVGTWTRVNFNTVASPAERTSYNIGSHFNLSAKCFEAPSKGIYFIESNICFAGVVNTTAIPKGIAIAVLVSQNSTDGFTSGSASQVDLRVLEVLPSTTTNRELDVSLSTHVHIDPAVSDIPYGKWISIWVKHTLDLSAGARRERVTTGDFGVFGQVESHFTVTKIN